MKKQPSGLLLALFLFPLCPSFLTALSPDSVDHSFQLFEPQRPPQSHDRT